MTCPLDKSDKGNCRCGPMKGLARYHTVTMIVKTRASARCVGVMEKAIQQNLTKTLEELDVDLTTMDDEMEWMEVESITDVVIEVA